MQRRYSESLSKELPIILSDADSDIGLRKKGLLKLAVSAMRPHQWVKNLFIFAPLLFGRKLTEISAVGHALLAFGVFCFLSSSLYIFNDWLDADEDRAHPQKRHRPISSGELPVSIALTLASALAATAFLLAWQLDTRFFLIALLYLGLTLAYCLLLKRVMVLDCIVIHPDSCFA